MKRKIYNHLQKWKNQWQGRTALLIDGARRIGKSWIAEEFGKNEYKSYIIIDFNNVSKDILGLFENYLTDLDSFFTRLSLYTGVKLHERKSLIIFDEVQIYPKARAAIKYLVNDGRYDYIETGSLVSINHNVRDIVIPSEEVRVNMYPMDFEEFLWALDSDDLFTFAKEQINNKKTVGQPIHRKLMDLMRTYMVVGGMPQAVLSYIQTKDFTQVEAVKKNILTLYRNDISKYAGKSAPNVTRIFDNIPGLLSQHEKRFRPSKVTSNGRLRTFFEPLFWLDESRVVNLCYSTTEPSVGLALNRDDSKLKIYMADTGLLVTLAIYTGEFTLNTLYEKIITGKLEFNKGMIVENLVAQLLRSNGIPLFFYSSTSRENSRDRMEIDFLVRKTHITTRHNIIPIEVKSSNRYSLSSLEKFTTKFKNYLAYPLVLHTGDYLQKDGIEYLPLYMAGNIPAINDL